MIQFLRQSLTVIQVASARLRFVAVFVIAALVFGYWDNIKNHFDKWTRPAIAPDPHAQAAASSIEFYCPMHPDVVPASPGQCPKCGMPLVKRTRGQAQVLPADVLARVNLTPRRLALANVQTSAVEYRPLVREIRSFGILDYDETRVAQISARVPGRVDELFVRYTGQAVKQGDPVYAVYSPEAYTAQREYLLARKRANELPQNAGADAKMDASAVYNAALQKLVLWGISQEQLDKLDHEFDETGKVPIQLTVTSPLSGIVVKKAVEQGRYLQVGEDPYTIADLSRLWVQLKLYERDVPLVKVGDSVDLVTEAFPNETFTGAVTFKAFQLDPETRTLDARVEVDNADMKLRPGMFASATVRIPIAAANAGAATSQPTSQPATQPTTAQTTSPAAAAPSSPEPSAVYRGGLAAYLDAQKLMSQDKADNVAALLEQAVAKMEPLGGIDATRAAHQRLADAVRRTKGQPIAGLRESFKEVSAAMIDLGKTVGLPADAAPVRVFRCPMKKANWLQEGDGTANPYYGSEMFDCGTAVEPLPKAKEMTVLSRPSAAAPAGKVLSVPRSAVIDTGKDKIVYVESSPGVFDMHAVKLGPLAGDYYPVLGGMEEGDRVVTIGTFLVDAENRLNPQPRTGAATETPAAMPPQSSGSQPHKHDGK